MPRSHNPYIHIKFTAPVSFWKNSTKLDSSPDLDQFLPQDSCISVFLVVLVFPDPLTETRNHTSFLSTPVIPTYLPPSPRLLTSGLSTGPPSDTSWALRDPVGNGKRWPPKLDSLVPDYQVVLGRPTTHLLLVIVLYPLPSQGNPPMVSLSLS